MPKSIEYNMKKNTRSVYFFTTTTHLLFGSIVSTEPKMAALKRIKDPKINYGRTPLLAVHGI